MKKALRLPDKVSSDPMERQKVLKDVARYLGLTPSEAMAEFRKVVTKRFTDVPLNDESGVRIQ